MPQCLKIPDELQAAALRIILLRHTARVAAMLRFAALARPAVRAQLAAQAKPAVMAPLASRFFCANAFLDRAEVADRVLKVVKSFEKVDPKAVSDKAHFVEDLGLDSLDTVEVVMAFEEEFCVEVPDAEAEKILTVEDAINFFSSHPQAK